jgi:hypothetical protein
MGSMPRREEHERKARERAAVQPALDCEACGALTPGARFRYFGDRVVCTACEHHNLQSRVRSVDREWLGHRTILVAFGNGPQGLTAQAMHPDDKSMLGPRVKIATPKTLQRLLAYLGATPAQLAEFDNQYRWGQGTVKITLVPERRNLLRLRN